VASVLHIVGLVVVADQQVGWPVKGWWVQESALTGRLWLAVFEAMG
jgi:hypothetical protein